MHRRSAYQRVVSAMPCNDANERETRRGQCDLGHVHLRDMHYIQAFPCFVSSLVSLTLSLSHASCLAPKPSKRKLETGQPLGFHYSGHQLTENRLYRDFHRSAIIPRSVSHRFDTRLANCGKCLPDTLFIARDGLTLALSY